jgi:type I restriction enzyme, S subunit
MNPLPDGWRVVKIHELTTRSKQCDPRKKPDKPFRYVDVSSVSNELFRIVDPTEMLGAQAPSRARKEIKAKDVLFATVRPTLKRIALVPPELDGEIASTGYCVLRPQSEKIVPEFLYHSLLTDSFVGAMGALERGASYPAIRDTDIYAAAILLPPLPEQRRITQVLSTVQSAIAQQERLITTTGELKRALMRKLLMEGLRGEKQKVTEIGQLPVGWEIVKLGELVSLRTGKLDSNAAVSSGQYPFFTCSQETARIDSYAFDTEAILLAGNNARGVYSVKHYRGKFNAYQRTYVITLYDATSMPYSFLLYALAANLERLQTLSIGTSTKYLTLGILKNLVVPKPNYDEAVEIGHALQLVDKKIVLAQEEKHALEELFHTLLHQLMTAQIRVSEFELDLPMGV